jgi:hypothetical protein
MTNGNYTLKQVRLSFPSLFKPKSIQGSEPKYSASFLIEKDDPQLAGLRAAIQKTINDKWEKNRPKGIKICLHNGDEKEYDGYTEGIMFLNSSSARRPTVIDRDKSRLTEEDGRPYAGCYVNAIVRLWAQDNQFGKRINAELCGVQFAAEGEAFGGGKPVTADDFDEVSED